MDYVACLHVYIVGHWVVVMVVWWCLVWLGNKFFSLLCPIVFSPFDRPLTHTSFFNIVYFSLISLRPSGRFETNTRLCLSMSDYHPESWNPSWSVETLLVGLQSFMYEENNTAIGSVKWFDIIPFVYFLCFNTYWHFIEKN